MASSSSDRRSRPQGLPCALVALACLAACGDDVPPDDVIAGDGILQF